MATGPRTIGPSDRDREATPEIESAPLGLERQLSVHYEIARAFAGADTLEDVAQPVLRALTEVFGWEAAALWLPTNDGSALACVAIHTPGEGLSSWRAQTVNRHFSTEEGLPGRVWSRGEPIWVRDTDDEENFPRRDVAHASNLRHGFAFPIRVGGKVGAVIELLAAEVKDGDAAQIAFYEAVGHQLGSFIERVQVRREVAFSEARKSGVLEAAVDAIVCADARGCIIEFNRAAERLFGWPAHEVVGRTIGEMLVPDELRDEHENGLTRYLATGEAQIIGHRVRTNAKRADGSHVPVELTVTEVRLEGEPMFTAFIRDVSREREGQIARDRFLEILSHELRTPVTAIYGGAKFLERQSIEPNRRLELLRDISAEADRLYRLVEDLIVLARTERGVLAVELEPVLLDRVVERVVNSIRGRADGVELSVVQHGPPMAVQGDETYVEQLVRNLLTNALKYGGAGGEVQIDISHGRRGSGAADGLPESVVKVLDRGPGIDPDEATRLFEIDYRSPKTTGLADGSGIGLFVARWLVEGMGGRIWARPRAGGGAEFGFALRGIDPDAVTDVVDLG